MPTDLHPSPTAPLDLRREMLERFARPRAEGEPPLVAVGTMNFGKRTPRDEAHRIVARAFDALGMPLFDTANVYEKGESEKILGAAVKGRRDACLLASKVGLDRVGNRAEGLAPETVTRACEASLTRLGTDYLDVYYLHAPDHATPIEATLEAVKELLDAQKIRAFGVSNYASWQILEIFGLCDRAGMPRPILAQQIYNLLIRQLDLEYMRFAKKYALHTTTYNALAGGLLARDHVKSEVPKGSRFDGNGMYMRRYWSDHFFAFVGELKVLAAEAGLPLASFAYAWLAGAPGVDSILLGPGDVAQLDVALSAIAVPLDPAVRRRVDELHRAFTGTDTGYAR